MRRPFSTFAAVIIAVASLSAQSSAPATTGTVQDNSMASLVTEVRLLRQAVETSTRSQVQVAALGVALSAEQSRIVQISTELTSVHAVSATATATRTNVERELTSLRRLESSTDLAAPMRQELPLQEQDAANRLELARNAEADAQAREATLTQTLQVEEARWADLVGQLQQFFK
jgi:hypothetical protein